MTQSSSPHTRLEDPLLCCLGVSRKPVVSCFSTEREEAESASLSAKVERFGRLEAGVRRRGGVVVDTSDTPHLTLHRRFLLFPSRLCKMPETESESEPLLPNPWNRNTCRGWSGPLRISV